MSEFKAKPEINIKYDFGALQMVEKYANSIGEVFNEMYSTLKDMVSKLEKIKGDLDKAKKEVESKLNSLNQLKNRPRQEAGINATDEEKRLIEENNRQLDEEIKAAQHAYDNAYKIYNETYNALKKAQETADEFYKFVKSVNQSLVDAYNTTSREVKEIKQLSIEGKQFKVNIGASVKKYKAYESVNDNEDVNNACSQYGYEKEKVVADYLVIYDRDGQDVADRAIKTFIENIKSENILHWGEHVVGSYKKGDDFKPSKIAVDYVLNDDKVKNALLITGGTGLEFINSITEMSKKDKDENSKLKEILAAIETFQDCPESMRNYKVSYTKLTNKQKERYKLRKDVDQDYDAQVKEVNKNGYKFKTLELVPKGLTWLEQQTYYIHYQKTLDKLDNDPKVFTIGASKSKGIVFGCPDAFDKESRSSKENVGGVYYPDTQVITINNNSNRRIVGNFIEHEIAHLIDDLLKKGEGFYTENSDFWKTASKEHLEKLRKTMQECEGGSWPSNAGESIMEYFAIFASIYSTEIGRQNLKKNLGEDYEEFEKLLTLFEKEYGKTSSGKGKSKSTKEKVEEIIYIDGDADGDYTIRDNDTQMIRNLADIYWTDVVDGVFNFFDENNNNEEVKALELWEKLYTDNLEKFKRLNFLGFEAFPEGGDFEKIGKEFFVDMIIAYFTKADDLRKEFPDIYNELTRIFGEDVGGRFSYFMSDV